MLYGLIRAHDYVKDPAISFCAVGDVNRDAAPLQVSPFQEGKWVEFGARNLYLEGGQGGEGSEGGEPPHESYELAAYFYNRFTELTHHELAFFFVIGDESFEEHPSASLYEKCLGVPVEETLIDGRGEWKRLMATYNVFHIRKQYGDSVQDRAILSQWVTTLGQERVLSIQSWKACLDVILGAMAVTSGVRTLDTYLKDLEDRAVPEDRVAEVQASLRLYADALANGRVAAVDGKTQRQLKASQTSKVCQPPTTSYLPDDIDRSSWDIVLKA